MSHVPAQHVIQGIEPRSYRRIVINVQNDHYKQLEIG